MTVVTRECLSPRVSSSSHEPDHRREISPSKVGEVMGSTLLIPSGLSFIIKADGLPRLPFMNHGEVLGGFPQGCSLQKKNYEFAKCCSTFSELIVIHVDFFSIFYGFVCFRCMLAIMYFHSIYYVLSLNLWTSNCKQAYPVFQIETSSISFLAMAEETPIVDVLSKVDKKDGGLLIVGPEGGEILFAIPFLF